MRRGVGMRRLPAWLSGALLLAAAGCGPLVRIGDAPPPPAALFALRSEAAQSGDLPAAGLPAAAGAGPAARAIVVETPLPVAALRTVRLPVTLADTRIAYLKDAAWLEPPARQFQRLLLDHLARRPGVAALEARLYDGAFERRLGGSLAEFGLDVREPGRPEVVLRFDAVLTGPRGALIAARRFAVARPAASQAPRDVTAALNGAANELAAAIASWAAAAPLPDARAAAAPR